MMHVEPTRIGGGGGGGGGLNRSRIDPPTESKLGACPGSLGAL